MLNEVDPDGEVASHGFFGDQPIPVAGQGAPLVSEFAAMELAAALGMSTDAGKAYLGRVLELRYRLPRLWARIGAGRLPVWRGFRIADHTISLPAGGCGACGPSPGPGRALVFLGAAGTPGRRSNGAVRPRSRRSEAT